MALSRSFEITASDKIESELGEQLRRLRLARNITQKNLALEAGIGLRTLKRLEAGDGTSLDTFVRILIALGIQNNLALLVPDPNIRPVERVRYGPKQRQRARPTESRVSDEPWTWDEEDNPPQ